jgi:uncharacterized membrane protein
MSSQEIVKIMLFEDKLSGRFHVWLRKGIRCQLQIKQTKNNSQYFERNTIEQLFKYLVEYQQHKFSSTFNVPSFKTIPH